MVISAIQAGNLITLRTLLEYGPNAPVTAETLEAAIRSEIEPKMLKLMLEIKPDVHISSALVELAVELNREETVKWLFTRLKNIQVTKEILRKAAYNGGLKMGLTEYLLDHCDLELITHGVQLTAACRYNSPEKMVALLLKRNNSVPISDEILLASTRYWDGRVLDLLLEYRGRQKVPNEIIDRAVASKNTRLLGLGLVENGVRTTLPCCEPSSKGCRRVPTSETYSLRQTSSLRLPRSQIEPQGLPIFQMRREIVIRHW
jgi:hypothetical protein